MNDLNNRSLFDAPQAVDLPKTLFVPTGSELPGAEGLSRLREADPKGLALIGVSTGLSPRLWDRLPFFLQTALRAVFRLAQRVLIAEAALVLTAVICALVGFPAIVTAFFVALVGFIVNCWIAVRTLGPVLRRLVGGRA